MLEIEPNRGLWRAGMSLAIAPTAESVAGGSNTSTRGVMNSTRHEYRGATMHFQSSDLLRADYGDQVGPERASELWRAFVSGQWLLLDHDFCDGHRRILTCYESSNPATGLLTARERRAAFLVTRGQSFKEVAFELGVAVSTAWTLVGSVVRKLGLRSRVELVQIFGIGSVRASDAPGISGPSAGSSVPSDVEHAPGLPCPPGLSVRTFEIDGRRYALFRLPLRRLEPPSCLTHAEREIVKGVLSERSNAEIARTRQTSKNTVANQLRAVYTKLGISGRSQLIAFC